MATIPKNSPRRAQSLALRRMRYESKLRMNNGTAMTQTPLHAAYRKRVRPTRAILAAFFWLVAGMPAALAGSLGDLDPRLRHVRNIESIAVSMEALSPYESVKKLPQRNCTFASEDPKKIAALLKAFTDYKTRRMPDNRVFLPMVEIEIHFVFKNGQRGVLYLGKRYLNEKTIDGELAIESQPTSVFFWVDRGLSEQLLEWVQVADDVLIDSERSANSSRDLLQECRDKASGKEMSGGPGACGKHMLSHPEVCGQN